MQDQNLLKREISEVKQALAEEKALNAKRHEDLLSAISALMANSLPHPLLPNLFLPPVSNTDIFETLDCTCD